MAESKAHKIFVAHYKENKDKVFTYLMYRLNFDRQLCEDLLMDIVLKAYEKYEQYNPQKGSFKNWIFGIAHNHLMNYYRDHKPVTSIEHAEEVAYEQPLEGPPSIVVQKILGMLTEVEREVIALRYLSDLSYEEIADMTGKSEGAVRTSLSRAQSQFRTFYKKLYGETLTDI
jgi:RNA polymerase sigma-70 factor (ECF subfamily)